MIDKSEIDDWMRKSALRFLERVSFDPVYIREVNEYQKNKDKIDFVNQLKEIRNRRK